MKGLIIINAFFNSEEYLYQPLRLQEEFKLLNIEIDIMQNNNFAFIISNNNITSFLNDYDFCIYLDKDKYILKALDAVNIPVFNSSDSIITCDDKFLTYLKLANNNIPLIKTLPGLLCYSKNAIIPKSTYDKIEQELNYPLILKETCSSLGAGVHKINNRQELETNLDQFKCYPHLFQEYIDTSFGKDLRVICIGNKVIGGILRNSKNDFRSNLSVNGNAINYEVPSKTQDLAIKISSLLGLDYCGIDFLFDKNNNPTICCEVNSNAFFCGFEKTTNINIAKIYATYIKNKITN